MLKNASFYGSEKKAYWVRKNGGMTHRDILRRDIDEALSKVSTYQAFIVYLERLGYKFHGEVRGPSLSVIAQGWQRPVRLKSLGAKYTPDAIYDQLMDNQRKPELYWIHYPEKRRTPLLQWEYELQKMRRMSGVQLVFTIFIELLKNITPAKLEYNLKLRYIIS